MLLQGENVHYSAENTSPVSRHSYSMHLVESAPGVTWSADNWCVPGAGGAGRWLRVVAVGVRRRG